MKTVVKYPSYVFCEEQLFLAWRRFTRISMHIIVLGVSGLTLKIALASFQSIFNELRCFQITFEDACKTWYILDTQMEYGLHCFPPSDGSLQYLVQTLCKWKNSLLLENKRGWELREMWCLIWIKLIWQNVSEWGKQPHKCNPIAFSTNSSILLLWITLQNVFQSLLPPWAGIQLEDACLPVFDTPAGWLSNLSSCLLLIS